MIQTPRSTNPLSIGGRTRTIRHHESYHEYLFMRDELYYLYHRFAV